jgi:hypothetical protein
VFSGRAFCLLLVGTGTQKPHSRERERERERERAREKEGERERRHYKKWLVARGLLVLFAIKRGLYVLDVPHINTRPLSSVLLYAKLKVARPSSRAMAEARWQVI